MQNIAIVDYGMGNIHSVRKALQIVAPKDVISVVNSAKEIDEADKIVLPGVGAIGECIKALKLLNLDKSLISNAGNKPLLAICVGMQLLIEFSEENHGVNGLGLLPGKVKKIIKNKDSSLKVPHMGWNSVKQLKNHYIWNDIPDESYFYFAHSYACDVLDETSGSSFHGKEFSSALAVRNIFAVQFHPEKSQNLGLKIYENFSKWNGDK